MIAQTNTVESITHIARLLKVSRQTLYRRMKEGHFTFINRDHAGKAWVNITALELFKMHWCKGLHLNKRKSTKSVTTSD